MKNLNNSILRVFIFLSLAFFSSEALMAQNTKSKNGKDNKTANKDQHEPENETKTSTKATTGAGVKEEIKMGTLKNHGAEIQKVIKNENGVIRGYDFGTSRQKIRDTEDAKFIADGKDFLLYEVVINEKEKAEIVYYLDENQNVRGFGIEFLISPSAMAEDLEATLVDDFQKYFNERYGAFKVNDKNDEVWTSQDGSYTIEMGDSSEGTMIEIEIEIFKK